MRTHVFLIDDDIDEMKLFAEALKEVVDPCKCTMIEWSTCFKNAELPSA